MNTCHWRSCAIITTTNIFIIAATTGIDSSYVDLGRRLWTPVRTIPAARSKVNGVRFRCLAAGLFTLGPMRSLSCCFRFLRGKGAAPESRWLCVHCLQERGVHNGRQLAAASTKLWGSCIVVGACNAVWCAKSLPKPCTCNFKTKVVRCIACTCRNHPFISAWSASLDVVPDGKSMRTSGGRP